jgi:hypothetical protein
MLIQRILYGYREPERKLAPARPVVSLPARRRAANADDFEHSAMRARRSRRQRRLNRSTSPRIGGWAVTTW